MEKSVIHYNNNNGVNGKYFSLLRIWIKNLRKGRNDHKCQMHSGSYTQVFRLYLLQPDPEHQLIQILERSSNPFIGADTLRLSNCLGQIYSGRHFTHKSKKQEVRLRCAPLNNFVASVAVRMAATSWRTFPVSFMQLFVVNYSKYVGWWRPRPSAKAPPPFNVAKPLKISNLQ